MNYVLGSAYCAALWFNMSARNTRPPVDRPLPGGMLEDGLDLSLKLKNPVLVDLLQIWRDARGDKDLPTRSDVDPIVIGPALLPYVLLIDVEYLAKRRYRWRLIGTHIVTALERDSTGKYWDDIYTPDTLAALSIRADWVVQHRTPVRAAGHTTSGEFNTNIETLSKVESLYLPLSQDGETINVILVGAVYSFRK